MTHRNLCRSCTIGFLLFLVLGSTGAIVVSADDELTFVYGTNHYDGAVYRSTMIPPNVDQVYLMADEVSILVARRTVLYYWPITSEYKPDWDAANQIVEGDLELYQGEDQLESLPLTEYVLQYDGLDRSNTSVVYLGEEARQAHQQFEQQKTEYRENLAVYHEALTLYREELGQALAQLQQGEISEEELPSPPQPMEDMSLFSSEILYGYPLQLPVGSYRMQIRTPQGEVIPESVKELVVFRALQEGIGYEIRSEARWNVPEFSQVDADTLYTLPGHVFYVTPEWQNQYNQLAYTRMNNPQDTQARLDRTLWVSHHPALDVMLQMTAPQDVETLDLQGFYVSQLMGSRLGYEITVHDPLSLEQPTFSGFRVIVPPHTRILEFDLLDEAGDVIPGSHRWVHVLYTNHEKWIYIISALPLFMGMSVLLFRRYKTQRSALSNTAGKQGRVEP